MTIGDEDHDDAVAIVVDSGDNLHTPPWEQGEERQEEEAAGQPSRGWQ